MAAGFFEKTDEQEAILEMVRQFVDEQIIPKAAHYDAADEYPAPIVEQMKDGETPTHAQLGIRITDVADDEITGAQVAQVGEGSTAAAAGLEPGDVVTHVDDRHISGADSLVATIRSYRPGDTVQLRWLRDGEEMEAEVELDSDAPTSGS